MTTVLLIGGGNMGAALAQCWCGDDSIALTIAETDPAKRRALAEQGFDAPEELDIHEGGFDIVVLAIKPQTFPQLAPQLGNVVGDATLVSIMAGVSLAELYKLSPHAARVMPNTPAMVGEGMSVLCAPSLAADRMRQVEALFEQAGLVTTIADENLMHAVTAISGSGPAYVFAFMEALEAAAIKLGLDAATARTMVTQTVLGSAILAHREEGDTARLRQQVTSPGGTTEAALKQFKEGDLASLVLAGAKAAKSRSEAMS